jgi:hypothetical protein
MKRRMKRRRRRGVTSENTETNLGGLDINLKPL